MRDRILVAMGDEENINNAIKYNTSMYSFLQGGFEGYLNLQPSADNKPMGSGSLIVVDTRKRVIKDESAREQK